MTTGYVGQGRGGVESPVALLSESIQFCHWVNKGPSVIPLPQDPLPLTKGHPEEEEVLLRKAKRCRLNNRCDRRTLRAVGSEAEVYGCTVSVR